jgi:hypothetical protein
MPLSLSFTSKVFDVDTIELEGHKEQIVKGGRHLFPACRKISCWWAPAAASGVSSYWPRANSSR